MEAYVKVHGSVDFAYKLKGQCRQLSAGGDT